MSESTGGLFHYQRSRQAPFPSPVPQHKHTATCENEPSLPKLLKLHPPPLCFCGSAPSTKAYLSSGVAVALPNKTSIQILPTSYLLTVPFAGPLIWWQQHVNFRGRCTLLKVHPPPCVLYRAVLGALISATPACPLWKRTSTILLKVHTPPNPLKNRRYS